ncbi:uncharacterized protein LOC124135709 [Haliotis rufescens]|uniref:uncharacterized protein LOC124135709 n=1 Tax=Haliotis rufescens TaxID=6454 RepID=UPI00201F8C3C|nr:uncharacterized protein LOC124135709 [Haliotis rufescens]
MGTASSTDNKGSEISPISVPDSLDSYPPPKPPISRKTDVFREADYAHVDSHAKSASSSVTSDYESLLNYLFEDLKTDLQMVRAIFTWLGTQRMEQMRLGNVKDPNTPVGYMKLIQQQRGSYAAFFSLLCRAAKIPCVVLRGKAKAVGYEPGDEDVSKFNSKWNAVHVGGQWRLVHPLWAFTGVEGHSNGKWTMIERKGEGQREKEIEYKGKDIRANEDFFFLTDPENFVNFCRANSQPWQLLKEPWSEEQFVKAPYLTTEYFNSGLKLTSQQTCYLVAKNGKEAIRFEHAKDKNPSLSYDLFCDEDESDETLPESEELERYVLENTQGTTKSLFLRFPVRGLYKLRVYGGNGSNPPHICDFRIRCEEEGKNPNPFPLKKDIGYGYSQEAKDAGLVTTSAYSGIVVMEHGQKMTFEFDVDKPVEFETKMHHRDKTLDELDKYVEKNVTDKKAEITVTMPEEGLTRDSEYALEINTREKDSHDSYRNVCNYFLTPDKAQWKDDSDAKPNNRVQQRPARAQVRVQQKPAPRQRPRTPVRSESPRFRMRGATDQDSIEDLERTIRDFEKSDLDEKDEDLTRAKERLVQLRNKANKDEAIRKRMRDATKEDSIEDLERAIEDFEDGDLDEKNQDLTKAKERLKQLKKKKEEEDAIRQRMRDDTDGDSIEDLEKSIRAFEEAGIDERDRDLTLAKERLRQLKNDAYQEPEPKDERAREAMRDATENASADELEKAIKEFEDSGLDEKDEDLTKAKEKLVKLKANKLVKSEEDKLRKKLDEAQAGDNMDALDKALEDCKRAGLEDEGDITKAEKTLMDMHKEKLEEARRQRDAEKLQKALEDAEKSAVADKLDDTEDFQEAKETNEQLARVKKFNRQVMDLNPRLVSEIASYKRPKPCIQDVMKATYIVLGEKQETLDWQRIVKLMKTIGQNNVIRRVGQFDIVGVEAGQAKTANKLISKYDMDDVKRNSHGAGTFYSWTRNVVNEVNRKDEE